MGFMCESSILARKNPDYLQSATKLGSLEVQRDLEGNLLRYNGQVGNIVLKVCVMFIWYQEKK